MFVYLLCSIVEMLSLLVMCHVRVVEIVVDRTVKDSLIIGSSKDDVIGLERTKCWQQLRRKAEAAPMTMTCEKECICVTLLCRRELLATYHHIPQQQRPASARAREPRPRLHSVYDRAGDEGPRSLHNHGEGPYHVTGGDVTTMLARHLLLPLVVLVVLLAPVLVTISPEQVYQEVSLDQVCRAGAKVGNNLVIY